MTPDGQPLIGWVREKRGERGWDFELGWEFSDVFGAGRPPKIRTSNTSG